MIRPSYCIINRKANNSIPLSASSTVDRHY